MVQLIIIGAIWKRETSNSDLLNLSVRVNISVSSSEFPWSIVVPESSILHFPMSVVLRRHQQPDNAMANRNSASSNMFAFKNEVKLNSNFESCFSDKNDNRDQRMGQAKSVEYSSCESLTPKPKIIPPSPAFNRNPSYFLTKCFSFSPSNNCGSFLSSTDFFLSSPCFSNHHDFNAPKLENNKSPCSPSNNFDLNENEELHSKADLEIKRKQASQWNTVSALFMLVNWVLLVLLCRRTKIVFLSKNEKESNDLDLRPFLRRALIMKNNRRMIVTINLKFGKHLCGVSALGINTLG